MPGPIRLTRRRAAALAAVFEIGARDVEEAIRDGAKFLDDAHQAEVLRQRDHELAAARDAMAIVRHRYLGGEEPTEPEPSLF